MTDTDAEIAKAFIAALMLQTEPLSVEVQSALNTIGQTFEIEKLHNIAEDNTYMRAFYQEAIDWQTAHSGIRSKGKMVRPNSASEKQNTMNTELDNTSSSISNLQSLPDIIEQIEQKVSSNQLTELIGKIFSASDSRQAAQSFVLPLL